MDLHGWSVFALFWVVFVTTPGPNAVNCMQNGMAYGLRRSLWGVAAILTQASLFLCLSALGVAALIATSPQVFFWAKMLGAGVLVWLGLRGLWAVRRPIRDVPRSGRSIYLRALLIATVNAKSLAGYLAAFTQFVQPDVPIGRQMWAIVPTALTITATSYVSYTALGAGLGRIALGAVLNRWFRGAMALCFIVYGLLLGGSAWQGRVT
ncbi:LysE family translocator [Frigidibacter sp. ROC022]|uniref:LysE family translocator n=1 Tax=Frigidibacter sp. ROC022 TaxID=2971796 RepID=UPI00215A2817|nr:LysE family translocator [Frigidibacter sp. ROC022]MCR8724973.1 LysE family translocator [Frigidibacter sp. ROC022]